VSAPRLEPYVAPGAALAVPVHGVRAEQLRDSYSESRSGGRVHRAIDIMAARGTPVLAAEDGSLLLLRNRGMGGISMYHLSTDGRRLLYYAHLDRFAPGVQEGAAVRRGQVIGYVGDTGNAGAGNFHLHFAVTHLPAAGRWGENEGGYDINPYPLLVGALAARRAAR
jgi:murein DD-endopeptidase MepM/ murein hydrolase activator NlpD